MEAEKMNPYATSKEGEPFLAGAGGSHELQPPLAPLTNIRLVIAIGLIAVGWIALWMSLCHGLIHSALAIALCYPILIRVTDPHAQRREGEFKLHHGVLLTVGFAAFIALIMIGPRLSPHLKAIWFHPAVFLIGWLIQCGFALRDWWRRRNNPPYLP